MESTIIIIAVALAIVTALLSMAVTLAICYIFWPSKLEELQYFPFSGSRKQSVVELKRHNVEDRLYQGPVGMVTPLITSASPVQPETVTSRDEISVQPLPPEIEVFYETESIPSTTINCTLDYNKDTSIFKIIISLTQRETSHPFLMRYSLLPFKKYLFEIQIKFSPVTHRWTETFSFKNVSLKRLPGSIFYLQLCTYHNWIFKTIGELRIPVFELIQQLKLTLSKTLQVPKTMKLGEILLSLIYDNQHNDLVISIIKTRYSGDNEPFAECYVTLTLINDEMVLEKKKTKILPCNPNPIFNETYRFKLNKYSVESVSLIATLVRLVETKISVGNVLLSSLSGGVSTKQWTDMQRKPRLPILQWHKLG